MVKRNSFSYLLVLVEVKTIVLNGTERELHDSDIVVLSAQCKFKFFCSVFGAKKDKVLCTELGLQFQKQRFMISLSLQACYKNNARLKYSVAHIITVIAIESAVKYSFVLKGMQTRRKAQYNAESTLSFRVCVEPLVTVLQAITYFRQDSGDNYNVCESRFRAL